jgi:predicted helicase
MFNFVDNNIALNTCRLTSGNNWHHVFVSKYLTDSCYISNKTKESNYIFPLYILKNGVEKLFFGISEPKSPYKANKSEEVLIKTENFTEKFRTFINAKYSVYEKITPEEIIGYIYAVLHSKTYRSKYIEFLKIDFPKIPFTDKYELFKSLSILGFELIQYHLLNQIPKEEKYKNLGNYLGNGDNVVIDVNYRNSEEQKLYINKTQYFEPVPKEIYDFVIGGYQVLDKYLKDRKNQKMNLEEITNIENIIKIIAFTIEQMEKIDILADSIL